MSSSAKRRTTPQRPESRPVIRLLQAVDVCFARIYHRLTIHSPCKLPRDGPAILVCNHTSGLDPLLIQSACPRLITWMMAREWYDIRALNWVFRTIGAIPVDRSGRDLSATRAALRALDNGGLLGVFPEGRIEPTRELMPFQPGVAMMAIKCNVPVYCAYLDGTQRGKDMGAAILRPCSAQLAFCARPVEFSRQSVSRESLDAASDAIRASVRELQKIAEMRSGRGK